MVLRPRPEGPGASAVGLLHPIVVRPDKTLVAGARRLAALEMLGRKEVTVHVVNGLDDALPLLQAERDENACRKELSPLEMVALGMALEAIAKPEADKRKKSGKSADGQSGGRGKQKPCGNLPQGIANGKTREQVAVAVGIGARTYEKARAVAEAAEAEPETYGPLAEEMDRTGNVDRAYKAMKRRKNPPPEPLKPRYPHSDRINTWLNTVRDETFYITTDVEGGGLGGLSSMLKERSKWDWGHVKNYTLPMLGALKDTLAGFEKEIANALDR